MGSISEEESESIPPPDAPLGWLSMLVVDWSHNEAGSSRERIANGRVGKVFRKRGLGLAQKKEFVSKVTAYRSQSS
jgi:hypothetical protein